MGLTSNCWLGESAWAGAWAGELGSGAKVVGGCACWWADRTGLDAHGAEVRYAVDALEGTNSTELSSAPASTPTRHDQSAHLARRLRRVKQPVKAVLMLFPITAAYEKLRKEEDTKIEAEGGAQGLEDVLWFPQMSASLSLSCV